MAELWPEGSSVCSGETLSRVAAGEILSFRTILSRAGAPMQCWETVLSPIFGSVPTVPVQLFTRSRDVTAEVDRLHFLDAVIDATPSALFVKDGLSGRFLLVNRAAESMLGFSRADMIGQRDHDLFPKAQADSFREIDLRVLETEGMELVEEEEVTTGDGETRWSRTRKSAVSGPGGARYLIGVAEDVTEAKSAAAAMRRALFSAEEANRAKSDFLTNMSHEIRTPLNGMLGMIQIMLADKLTEAHKTQLRLMRRSGETLHAILNDLLDLARIESSTIEIEVDDFDVEHAVRNAYAPFAPAAATKGLVLALDVDLGARGLFRGEGARFRRLLQILISNAVKFTDAGRIDVAVGYDGSEIHVVISDTGVGIAPERLPYVFDKFVQGDPSMSRRFGGAGLGLSICEGLTRLMGGSITVESTPGQGSAFTLVLPLARSLAPAAATEAPVHSTNKPASAPKVLAAEDHAVNQHVLKALLMQTGIQPVIVGDGRLALEAWEAEDWDLILMDIQMPGMDGIAATRAIRAREAATGRTYTPILAVTANVMTHQVEAYRAAGMDGVVAKPLDASLLFAALKQALSGPEKAPLIPLATGHEGVG